MQIVKTDSVKPQNKVGLPIGVSDLMFLNIIHLSKKAEDEIEIKNNVSWTPAPNKEQKTKKNLNMGKKGGGVNVSVAQRGYDSLQMRGVCSDLR